MLLPIYWFSILFSRNKRIWLFGSTFGRRFADNPRYFYLYVSQMARKNDVQDNPCMVDGKMIRAIWISHNKEIVEFLKEKGYQAKIVENIHAEQYEKEVEAQAKLAFLNTISTYCKGILRAGSESKVAIRREIEPRLSVLLNMMNDLIGDINRQLKQKQNKELLVIIEDMDKLDSEEAKHIFVMHRRPLISLKIKMIISFPIYMVYTSDFSMVKDDFNKCILYSMIKVNNSDFTRYEPGIQILKEIVAKRMELALIDNKALVWGSSCVS